MNKIGIYIIISPSGKIYVGQSINILNRRSQYKNLNKYCLGIKIYNSLRKYGWEAHKFDILEECLESDLDELEAYYKTLFVMEYGWSKTLFCQIRDGKSSKHSQEIINKIGQSLKEYYKINNHISKGKSKPKGFGDHIRNMGKGKTGNGCIPIIQKGKQGELINIWPSQIEASKKLKISYEGINHCLKGLSKSSGGFIWEYKDIPV
jgi:group I intron endonuclease